MNEHVLCFFIHKFTDGKEGGGCVRRRRNNAGYDSSRRAAQTIKKKQAAWCWLHFFVLLNTQNDGKTRVFPPHNKEDSFCDSNTKQACNGSKCNAVFFFPFLSARQDNTSFQSELLNWCICHSWRKGTTGNERESKAPFSAGYVTYGFRQDSLFLLIRHTQGCSLSHFLL